MALINITVVSERSPVLPWKISSALLEKESIREYYYRLCTGTAVLNNFTLTKPYLGRSKDALDLVDLDVELHQGVGPFLKFIVDGSSESACTTTLGTSAQSVVEVLMNSQRSLKVPSKITKENKTMKLFCLMM